jgi:predicted phosphodiesterase
VEHARRVAALYDIHGNLPALEAVLEEVAREDVDAIVVGGDVVPGPMPGRTVDMLLALTRPVHFICGNGERDVLAFLQGEVPSRVPPDFHSAMRWVADGLSRHHVEALAAWGATTRIAVAGLGEVLFCHATPRNDNEIFTRRTPEDRLRPLMEATGARVVVCGHTHMQFDRTAGDVRVANAGSVGMPFGQPGAYWALLGPAVELRRTSYDLEAAAQRIRATEYPDAAGFDPVRPPSADAMLEAFEAAALR